MLAHSAYGKSKIRIVQVLRGRERHDLRDLTVAIRFKGQYDESYTDGDNRHVLPTDTMKNTVYALAARDGIHEPETFGLALARQGDRSEKVNAATWPDAGAVQDLTPCNRANG